MNFNALALYSRGLQKIRFKTNTTAASLRLFEAINN